MLVSTFISTASSGYSDCNNSISITEVEDSGCCGARSVVTKPTESVNTVDVWLGEVRETEAGVRVVSEDALATGVIDSVAEAVQVVLDVTAAMEGSVEVTVASALDVLVHYSDIHHRIHHHIHLSHMGMSDQLYPETTA